MIYDYDLRYYYSDLNHIPCLTDEEQQHLMTAVLTAKAHQLSDVEAQVKARLVEGHLALATRIALNECPSARPYLLPDLVQEANLALMRASDRYDYAAGGDFTAYACAYMRGGIKTAIGADNSVGIPSYAWSAARKQGKLEQLRARLPVSLDRLVDEEEEENSLLATLAAPPVLLPAAPCLPSSKDEDERHAQVEGLLVYLSPLAQEVLRLRYGLRVGDERPRMQVEVARELGSTPGSVATIERDAMKRLRALVSGQACLVKHQGRLCISLSRAQTDTRAQQWRQARYNLLVQTYQRLEAQGVQITVHRLAELTHLPVKAVRAFLRAYRGISLTIEQRQARAERLREAYQQVVAAGQPPTPNVLRLQAHTSRNAAVQFLQEACQQQQVRASATSLAEV